VPATGEQNRRYFPGLKPDEERVWRVFLHSFEGQFTRFYYNVMLGEGQVVSPSALVGFPKLMEAHREWWRNLTRRKADVVALAEDGAWWLIEVEHKCGPGALGQLLLYDNLLAPSTGVEADFLAVVCAEIRDDTAEALAALDVLIYQVDLSTVSAARRE